MQQLNTFDNADYDIGKSTFIVGLWYVVNTLFFKSAIPFYGLKVALLRSFGAKVGEGVKIKPHVNIKYPWKLSIGDHVWIGEQVWIDNLDYVTIESHCCISQRAMLLCGNHNYKKPSFDLITGAITLKQSSWLCASAMLGPGVTMHENSILSPYSFANSDLEADSIYQGNPAVKVRQRRADK